MGFSGTKDTHRLWPLSVRKESVGVQDATDGKMFDLVCSCTETDPRPIVVPEEPEGMALWQCVIDEALRCGCQALIDAGAFLAGVDPEQIIQRVMSMPTRGDYDRNAEERHSICKKLKGVVYYHQGEQQWLVVNWTSGQRFLLKSSPIKERECFVIFDESHTRGTDMKLPSSAEAMVTIGPALCKENLVQACGRMRQLGKGQKLQFVVAPEVWVQLNAEASKVTVTDLLKWSFFNSVASCAQGMTLWMNQGLLHYESVADPSKTCVQDNADLETMYGDAIDEKEVALVCSSAANASKKKCPQIRGNVDELLAHVDQMAENLPKVKAKILDVECERELEQEEEIEEEEEIQYAKINPWKEEAWDYASFIKTKGGSPKLVTATEFIQAAITSQNNRHEQQGLNYYEFSKLCATSNFYCPVPLVNEKIDLFMREVDYVWQLASGKLLMLSPLEANGFARIVFEGGVGNTSSQFGLRALLPGKDAAPAETALHVFNGECGRYKKNTADWDNL